MMKYGEIIPGSVRRGYIKGTNIENGSRYLQIIKCAPTLPLEKSGVEVNGKMSLYLSHFFSVSRFQDVISTVLIVIMSLPT
jgi:hypothetical protein